VFDLLSFDVRIDGENGQGEQKNSKKQKDQEKADKILNEQIDLEIKAMNIEAHVKRRTCEECCLI
jgi:hypothetical protein